MNALCHLDFGPACERKLGIKVAADAQASAAIQSEIIW